MRIFIGILCIIFAAALIAFYFATNQVNACIPEIAVAQTADYEGMSPDQACTATQKEYDEVSSCMNENKKKSFVHAYLISRQWGMLMARKEIHNISCKAFPNTLVE